MVYTSFDMIRDCRAGQEPGWSYFIAQYLPVIRGVLEHYAPARAADTGAVLLALRESWFDSVEPVAEREFVVALRQRVLSDVPAPEATLDFQVLRDAWEPLTVVEKEAAWLEAMGYDAAAAGRMLRMDPETVEKIRERAGELLRARLDRWSRGLLAEEGIVLGRAAAAQASPECISARALLDVIDGRATWTRRQEMERHAVACWHCIDHFCRLHEACDLLRSCRPLSQAEAEPFHELLGLAAKKAPAWRRVLGLSARKSPARPLGGD